MYSIDKTISFGLLLGAILGVASETAMRLNGGEQNTIQFLIRSALAAVGSDVTL